MYWRVIWSSREQGIWCSIAEKVITMKKNYPSGWSVGVLNDDVEKMIEWCKHDALRATRIFTGIK